MQDIACIILTKDEALHIERCIRSAQQVCRDIWVIDSYSQDKTCQLAERLGAHVVQHPFTYQAEQFNWAIDTLPIHNAWIWRLDADEIISEHLAQLVDAQLPTWADSINGVYVNKQIVFMGHALKHGGWYPAPQIKIVRRGCGRSEDKLMDEHLVVLGGETVYCDGDQTDWNLHDIDWWWQKHLGYVQREARNMLAMEQQQLGATEGEAVQARLWGTNAERKRWMKRVYAHCPLYVRPVIYFLFRYIVLGGWLDGYAGWYWHTRQGLYYRLLVDRELSKLRKEQHNKT